MDITTTKAHLLDEYYRDFNPTPEEADAFLLGMVWLQDALENVQTAKRLNDYVDSQSIINRLEKRVEELMGLIERINRKQQSYERQLNNFIAMDKASRKKLRIESMNEYLTNEIKQLRKEKDTLIQRIIEINKKVTT